MKKLSVSLFALLAITFAITSAFTSQSKKMLDVNWFLTVTTPAEGDFSGGLFDDIATYGGSAIAPVDISDVSTDCPDESNPGTYLVCAARITNIGNGSSATQLEQADLSHASFDYSDILDILFVEP